MNIEGDSRLTLVAAACFPWGRLRKAAQAMGTAIEEAVILVADSRFTYTDTSRSDSKQKLHVLVPNAALALAGDVLAAQNTVRALQRWGRKQPGRHDPAQVIAYFSRRAFDRQRSWAKAGGRPPVSELYLLTGMCDLNGRASIVRSTSAGGFVPIAIPSGVDCAGSRKDVDLFIKQLQRIEVEWWEGGEMRLDPERWQFAIVGGVVAAISHPGATPYVGGPVASLLIKRTGITETQFDSLVLGGDPMKAADWVRHTAPLADMTPHQWGAAKTYPAAVPDLVCAHLEL